SDPDDGARDHLRAPAPRAWPVRARQLHLAAAGDRGHRWAGVIDPAYARRAARPLLPGRGGEGASRGSPGGEAPTRERDRGFLAEAFLVADAVRVADVHSEVRDER